MKERREKLKDAVAHSLGYYMVARLMGKDGKVQLQRHKRLCEALENYDKNIRHALLHEKEIQRKEAEESSHAVIAR